MHLSKEELELLINESVCGRYIQCRFGPSFVALNDAPENEWAKQRINEVRVAATGGAVAHVNQLAQPAICPHCQNGYKLFLSEGVATRAVCPHCGETGEQQAGAQ